MSNYIDEAQIEIVIVDYFSQSQIAFAIKMLSVTEIAAV